MPDTIDQDRLKRLEDKLDKMHESITRLTTELAVLTERGDRLAQLELRIGKLEEFRLWVLVAYAAMGGLTGFGGHFLAKLMDPPAPVEVAHVGR